ncbi:YbfB/YjiJ family MFS transporter, partial [Laribacter hongkongensis]
QPVAAVTAAYGVGQLLGPLLAGVLRQTSGSFALPSLVAALALLPALLFIPAATGYRLPALFGRAAIQPR